MEFDFKVKTTKPELVISKEYPLFWWGEHGTVAPDKIGVCRVRLEEEDVICNATVTTGGIKHLINDMITSQFDPNDIPLGKYEYGILLKEDVDSIEYVKGFCLFLKHK